MEESPMNQTSLAPVPPAAPAPRTGRRRIPPIVLSLAVAAGLAAGGAGAVMLTGGAQARTATLAASAPAPRTTSALQADLITAINKVGPAVVSIRTESGLGSGVIYDASGLVLTNAHVVNGATRLTIEMVDGRHFAGKTLGMDTGFDLAVVKIDGRNLPAAPLGDSASLQVGEFVIAIGNPYGLDHTVTTGVVSAINRPISEGQGSYNQPMIQTDAAINPGNSGGPLVDLQGNVVGINTLVQGGMGQPAQGLGFAVPVNTAKRIAPQIVASGRATRSGQPYLGVFLADLPQRGAENGQGPFSGRRGGQPSTPARADHGAVVVQTGSDGPSANAGIQAGDVITTFDGREVYDANDLLSTLVLHRPGDQVQVGFLRGAQSMNATVTIGEAPVSQG